MQFTGQTGTLALDEEGQRRVDGLADKLVWHQYFEHRGPDDLRRDLLTTLANYRADLRKGARPYIRQGAASFIRRAARKPHSARVFMGLRYLNLPGTLDVGIARFVPPSELGDLTPTIGGKLFEGCTLYCEVEVTGGDEDKLIERAARRTGHALSLLRLHLRQVIIGLNAVQLRFELHGAYIVASGSGASHPGSRWRGEPLALGFPKLPPELVATVGAEGQDIADLPLPFRERVDTALEWMDVAARAASWKTRIPAIFTAVESLLVPENCGRKAEVVIVRSVVLHVALGQGFHDPWDTYMDYLIRGDLVHGTPVGVDVTGEMQPRANLREWWARETIGAYVAYASQTKYPDAAGLVRELDRSEAAQQASRWFSDHGGAGMFRRYQEALHLPVATTENPSK